MTSPSNPASLRILMVCTKYNLPGEGAYLINDLAEAFVRLGHHVQVINIEWDAQPGEEIRRYRDQGVDVLRFPPATSARSGSMFKRLAKWTRSSFEIMDDVKRELGDRQFDLLVGFTPLVTTLAPVRWAMKRFKPRSYVYNPDFFPFYHRSNGTIPGGAVFAAAYVVEWLEVRRFDVVGCMSPANARYFEKKFPMRSGQRTHVLPLWGETSLAAPLSKEEVRRKHGLPIDRKIALFGGQLVEGRGIEDVLKASELAQTRRPDLQFLFVGRGRLQHLVEARMQSGGSNVLLKAPVPRSDYLELASCCDVGINATAPHVVVPTFPTKTIDYVRARLPIAAAVEAASDYGDFIEEAGLGLAAPSGDHAALLAIIERLVDDEGLRANILQAGPLALHRHFDVNRAAQKIVTEAFK